MIHPHTRLQFISDSIGYGVFATELIPEGTITYVKDSLEMEFSPTDIISHSPEMQATIEKYSYRDERGYCIVSWDFAKYVNHCCNCNTISTGYGFEIAIKDIQPGEQITDEYGIFNLTESMELSCGFQNCRKLLGSSDFDTYYMEWDIKIKKSIPKLFLVKQPLIQLVDEKTRRELDELSLDPQSYRSVYFLKYQEANLKKIRKKSSA
jgi:uncharacterized protein